MEKCIMKANVYSQVRYPIIPPPPKQLPLNVFGLTKKRSAHKELFSLHRNRYKKETTMKYISS